MVHKNKIEQRTGQVKHQLWDWNNKHV